MSSRLSSQGLLTLLLLLGPKGRDPVPHHATTQNCISKKEIAATFSRGWRVTGPLRPHSRSRGESLATHSHIPLFHIISPTIFFPFISPFRHPSRPSLPFPPQGTAGRETIDGWIPGEKREKRQRQPKGARSQYLKDEYRDKKPIFYL